MPKRPGTPYPRRELSFAEALRQLVHTYPDWELDAILADASSVDRVVPGCPPAPRLVCVETNPGPGKGRRSRNQGPSATTDGTMVVHEPRSLMFESDPKTIVVNRPRRRPAIAKGRFRTKQRPGGKRRPWPNPRSRGLRGTLLAKGLNPSAMKKYERSMLDPFQFSPPSITAGCLFTKSRMPLWRKNTLVRSIDAGQPGSIFVFYSLPSTSPSATAFALSNVAVATAANSGNPISGYVSLQNLGAANLTTYLAASQSTRTVTGGMNVELTIPSGKSPPVIYAGSIVDTPTNFYATSIDNLISNLSTVQIDCPTTQLGAYATYRPYDTVSFSFTSQAYTSASITKECISYVIAFCDASQTGNSLTYAMDVLYHCEQQSGVDIGVADESLGDADVIYASADDAVAAASLAPPGMSGPISDIASTIIDNLAHSAARNAFSLKTEGGLVPNLNALSPSATSSSVSSSSTSSQPTKPEPPVGWSFLPSKH